MVTSRFNRYWMSLIVFLMAVITVSSLVIWTKYRLSQPVEISLASPPLLQGDISVSGAVANPGIYPLRPGDSIEAVIEGAGGTTANADITRVEIYIPVLEERTLPQKVNINRAEAWLLEALPGIGETLAQRIIVYRERNGPFRSTSELNKVEGLGPNIYERIKDLVTVVD